MNDRMKNLRENFEGPLSLPASAVDWLLTIYDMAQTFDDLYDKDADVSKKDLSQLIWNSFIGMSTNDFYIAKQAALTPVVATALMKWHGANELEKQKRSSALSFAWRASYYDIVLFVVMLCHGREKTAENAHLVASLYGEKFENYKQEMKDA